MIWIHSLWLIVEAQMQLVFHSVPLHLFWNVVCLLYSHPECLLNRVD